MAWAGYIERGDSDKAYDWVTGFEKDTGCKVQVQIADTSDEMFTLMSEGNFDLVTASGDASLRLVAAKRVQPVPYVLEPRLEPIPPRYRRGVLDGYIVVYEPRRQVVIDVAAIFQ